MKTLACNIPLSLGDIIVIKTHLDTVKHLYSSIHLTPERKLYQQCLFTDAIDWKQKEVAWNKYLKDIGQCFFSEKPYVFDQGQHPYWSTDQIIERLQITPQKSELSNYLCRGESLNIGKYLVILTKCRAMDKLTFMKQSIGLWKEIKRLSKNYKIVILGEREVEMRKEYGGISKDIFGLYEQAIANLPEVIDLTVPALGENVSDFSKIQQDCLLMHEAEATLSFGIGGNFCMNQAVSKMTLAYRTDNYPLTDRTFQDRTFQNALVTKNWQLFLQKLQGL